SPRRAAGKGFPVGRLSQVVLARAVLRAAYFRRSPNRLLAASLLHTWVLGTEYSVLGTQSPPSPHPLSCRSRTAPQRARARRAAGAALEVQLEHAVGGLVLLDHVD